MKDCFGRTIDYMRVSVTERCNLHCRYCIPEDGSCKKNHEDMMSEEEMVLAVKVAASLGISKVRVTGGEPLVKRNLLSLCEKFSAVEGIRELCLTTNGILLPELAKPLCASGVKRVNISLDTLQGDKYRYITGNGRLDEAIKGMHAALDGGFEKVKINVVLIGGFNDDEIRPLAELTRAYPVDVRFIELMPMNGAKVFDKRAFIPASVVLRSLPELKRGEDEGVARLYRFPDGLGNVGLISPVSDHFCKSCSRIRLTADGKLKPCLHSSGEYALTGLDPEGMRCMMETAIWNKPKWHGPLSSGHPSHAGPDLNQHGG